MTKRPIIFSAPMVRALIAGRKTQTREILKVQPPSKAAFPYSDFGMSRCVADGVAVYSQNDYDRLPKHATDWELIGSVGVARNAGFPLRYRVPYAIGDRLWVREAHAFVGGNDPGLLITRADYPDCIPSDRENVPLAGEVRWRPSIHMPRWASRLTLEVTDVRVERLQDISEEDAVAEGCEAQPFPGPWWQGYRRDDRDGSLYHQQAIGEEPPGWMIDPKPMRSHAFLDRSAVDVFRVLWMDIHGPEAWAANPWVAALTFCVHHANIDALDDVAEGAG